MVEQSSPFLDADGKDPFARHGIGFIEVGNIETLVAYARIVPPRNSSELPSIGRVMVAEIARSHGLGKVVMERAIAEVHRLFPDQSIAIAAQVYPDPFYRSLGFVPISEPYVDEGVVHVEMILPSSGADTQRSDTN